MSISNNEDCSARWKREVPASAGCLEPLLLQVTGSADSNEPLEAAGSRATWHSLPPWKARSPPWWWTSCCRACWTSTHRPHCESCSPLRPTAWSCPRRLRSSENIARKIPCLVIDFAKPKRRDTLPLDTNQLFSKKLLWLFFLNCSQSRCQSNHDPVDSLDGRELPSLQRRPV